MNYNDRLEKRLTRLRSDVRNIEAQQAKDHLRSQYYKEVSNLPNKSLNTKEVNQIINRKPMDLL